MNELEAHEKATAFAISNSETWLDLAKYSINKGHHGQGYAIAVFAAEEIVKAVISFMVSRNYINTYSKLVKEVYSNHISKGRITLGHIFNPLFRRSLSLAGEDWKDFARKILEFPEGKQVKKPQQLAKDLENTRRTGVYVNVSEKNGEFKVRNPSNISKEMAKNMVQSVEVVLGTSKFMIEAHDNNPVNTRGWFDQAKRGFDYEIHGYNVE